MTTRLRVGTALVIGGPHLGLVGATLLMVGPGWARIPAHPFLATEYDYLAVLTVPILLAAAVLLGLLVWPRPRTAPLLIVADAAMTLAASTIFWVFAAWNLLVLPLSAACLVITLVTFWQATKHDEARDTQ